MAPNATMGCAMALEDAHVLAKELRLVDAAQVEQALASYVARRKARVEQIHHTADFLMWWIGLKDRGLVLLRNLGMHFAPPSVLL